MVLSDGILQVERQILPHMLLALEDGTRAKKLSEGERNFIAFLYFYHLVRGSQRSDTVKDKIVVIDGGDFPAFCDNACQLCLQSADFTIKRSSLAVVLGDSIFQGLKNGIIRSVASQQLFLIPLSKLCIRL